MASAEIGPEDWAEDWAEDGPDDGFYERFADELEVLAELGGGCCCGVGTGGGGERERARPCFARPCLPVPPRVPSGDRHRALTPLADEPSPPAGPKTSQFRGKRQPLEEPDAPTDSPGGTGAKKRDRDCVPAVSPAATEPHSRFDPVPRVLLPPVPRSKRCRVLEHPLGTTVRQ